MLTAGLGMPRALRTRLLRLIQAAVLAAVVPQQAPSWVLKCPVSLTTARALTRSRSSRRHRRHRHIRQQALCLVAHPPWIIQLHQQQQQRMRHGATLYPLESSMLTRPAATMGAFATTALDWVDWQASPALPTTWTSTVTARSAHSEEAGTPRCLHPYCSGVTSCRAARPH